jgi:hypothetical protein
MWPSSNTGATPEGKHDEIKRRLVANCSLPEYFELTERGTEG